jgi:hypothetical protein
MDVSSITKGNGRNGVDYDSVKSRMYSAYVNSSKKYHNKLNFGMKVNHDTFEEKEMDLINRYFRTLIEKGHMLTRKEIKEQDTIDITGLVDKDGIKSGGDLPSYHKTEEEEEYIKTHPYCFVPPMTRGVIKVNSGRYLTFDVVDLNVDEHKYKLYLEDYGKDKSVWAMNSSSVVELAWNDGTINILDEIYAPLSELFSVMSPLSMDFTEDEKLFWNKVIIPDIMLIDQMDEDEGKPHVVNNYIWCVVKTNMELSKNKLHTKRSSSNGKANGVAEVTDEKRKKQLIRNVGESGIVIKSVDIPREANYERIIRYKVASWNTRGHERKLKSGRVVYVKPSVHHRKALQGKCTDGPAQTVIQID